MNEILQLQLQAYLENQPATGSNPRIESFRSLHASRDDYAFTLVFDEPGGPVSQRLVLKTFPNNNEGIDRALKERHALYHLRQARYPVPGVVSVEISPEAMGMPFLIREDIDGTPLHDALVDADERTRRDLIAQFVALLVDLHERGASVLVKQLPAGSPFVLINREIHGLRGLADKRQQREYEPVLAWLHEHRKSVPCETPVVTNRGFTPHGILLSPSGRMYVHSWPWQISDPRYDIAWTLLDLARGALADLRAAVLAEYERVTGAPVEQLAYFEVLASTRWLMDTGYAARQRGSADEATLAQMRQARDLIEARTGVVLPDVEALVG